jgi:carboxyl-terminal processing protease
MILENTRSAEQVIVLRASLSTQLAPASPGMLARAHTRARVCAFGLLAVLLFSSAAAGQSPTTGVRPASVVQSVAVATFDSAWVRIRDTYYDATFRGVDWEAVRAELRPRAEQARTMVELREVLNEMVTRLGESHYSVIPYDVAGAVATGGRPVEGGVPGDVGMEIRLAGEALVVSRVEEGGPAERAGVRPGWLLEGLAGEPTAPDVARVTNLSGGGGRNALTQLLWSIRGRLEGAAGSTVAVDFRDEEGAIAGRTLVRRARPGEAVRFGNLPTFMAELSYERLTITGGCIGVIRFKIWMVPLVARFDRAMDDVRNCDGIVIDLRGNPGGIAGMVMGISGHFLNERIALGTMHSRGTSLNFVANPRRVDSGGNPVIPYAGPVAILVDGLSVSTSEFFAGGMQAIGRARIFGERTAGQALPATLLRLPSGDVLMYVVADFTAPDGSRIEGRGVIPDAAIPLDRRALLAGRDPAYEAAVAWLVARAGSSRN